MENQYILSGRNIMTIEKLADEANWNFDQIATLGDLIGRPKWSYSTCFSPKNQKICRICRQTARSAHPFQR
jgi:hypothetical protein